jgi:hypothetical protein
MNDVTRVLSAIERGDPLAAVQLLPLVYDELHKLAAQKLAQEKPGRTLQATALPAPCESVSNPNVLPPQPALRTPRSTRRLDQHWPN